MSAAPSSSLTSGTTGETRLHQAIKDFTETLTPSEKIVLQNGPSPERNNILELTAAINDKVFLKFQAIRYVGRVQQFLETFQRFSPIIDMFVSSDPKISALVWGSLKLLIMLTSLLERIAKLVPIVDRLEKLFDNSNDLKQAVAEFWAIAISMLHKAFGFLHKKGYKRFFAAILSPFDAQFQDLEDSLRFQRQYIMDLVQVISEEVSHAMRQQLTLFEFKSERWELQRSTESKEVKLRALVNSISDYDYTLTFSNSRKERHPGTGQWLFERPDFKQWVENTTTGTILWCHGIPGAGKSVLTTAVIDELLSGALAQRNPGTFVGYYFCDFRRPESLQIPTLLQSLVKQILTIFTHKIPPKVNEMLPTFCKGHPKYSSESSNERWFDFLKLVASIPERLYFCIDGIDECEVGEQCHIMEYLKRLLEPTKALNSGQAPSTDALGVPISNKKLYLSSRPEIPISRLLDEGSSANTHTKISLNAPGLERPEMWNYIIDSIKERLQHKRLPQGYEPMLDEIGRALLGLAKGMFLWISFQLDDICATNNVTELREVLASLPEGLDQTYARILRRIITDRARNPKVATKVFQWVAGAKRPLTVDEMAEAISIEPDDQTWENVAQRYPMDKFKVLENCANLIVLNNDDTIQFAHSTVLDFLCSQDLIPQVCHQFVIDRKALNTRLAHTCITYLSFPCFEQSVLKHHKITKCTPLSSRDIGAQIPLILSMSNSAFERGIGNTVAQYARIKASSLPASRVDLKRTVASAPEEVVPSSAAAKYMLNYIAENWWKHCSKVEILELSVGEHWTSKFDELCFHRMFHVQHLPWLLPDFKDSALRARDEYEAPFTWAVTSCHEALQHFIMSKLYKLGLPPATPISWARKNLCAISSSTHIQVYIIAAPDVLFSVPAELYIHFPDPLLVATCRGYTKVCRTLLDRKRAFDHESETLEVERASERWCRVLPPGLLGAACELGHAEIIKLFLQFDVTAISVMQGMGPRVFNTRGLERPIENSWRDEKWTWTPIELAFIHGHLLIINTLLIGIVSYLDWDAQPHQYTRVRLSLLIDFHKTIPISRVADGSMLQPLSATRRFQDWLLLYLNFKFPTESRVNRQWIQGNCFEWDAPTWKMAALLHASATGRTNAVQRILDINASGDDPKDYTSETKASATLLTFTPGLGVLCVGLGRYALLAAFEEGRGAVAKLLLAAGGQKLREAADGHVKQIIGIQGKNMLHIAAEKGHIEMVEALLLSDITGSYVNFLSSEGNTPLYYACVNDKLDIAQILVTAGANIRIPGKDGPLLHEASALGKVETVEFLVKCGVDVHMLDNRGRTAMEVAVTHTQNTDHLCLPILQKLLDSCRHSPSYQAYLDKALFQASGRGLPDVVEWLLVEGADCNKKFNISASGTTPLAEACARVCAGIGNKARYRKVIKHLLTAGAAVKVRHYCGDLVCGAKKTPLYHASHARDKEVVQLLLAAGADCNIRARKGRTVPQEIERAINMIRRLRSMSPAFRSDYVLDNLWVKWEDIDPGSPEPSRLVVYEEILALFRKTPPLASP